MAITTIALLSSTFGTSALASTYQVQEGDTLSQIAKKYNTSVSQLKTLNKLSADTIYINQTLKVASSTASPAPAAAKTTPKPATPKVTTTANTTTTETTYTVVKGDTLSKITAKYKISLSDLMKWNNLKNHIIYPGQKLKVSISSTPTKEVPKQEAVVKVPEKVTKPVEPQASSEYIVQNGDTLGHISSKVGMTITELKQLNNLTSDMIYVGQKLKLAGTSSPAKDTSVQEEAPPSELVTQLINQAASWMGIPYVWGGSSLSGFDCSGFIYYAFNAVGVDISRQSTEGYYSRSYYVDTPQLGDLVFFENTYKQGISHMGIYLGNNQFLHASTSKGVTISSLNEAYYQQRFDGFKRFY